MTVIVIRPDCTLITEDDVTRQIYPDRITIEYAGIDFDIEDIIKMLKSQ